MADAYYVLSDPKRRKEYDALYASQSFSNGTNDANSSSFFSQFTGMFGGSGATTEQGRPDAEGVFADVFEEVGIEVFFEVTIDTDDIIHYIATASRG